MRTFAEILQNTKPLHIVVAPAVGDGIDWLPGREHKVTRLAGPVAVSKACRMIREKEADILVQGDIKLADFWAALEKEGVKKDNLSHVTLLENRQLGKLLFITDTYIHNFPPLEQKIRILDNVITFAGLLGINNPRVAALSAIETVNPAIASTVDAAVLSRMSQRRQFQAVVDGPLDIDAILSVTAAEKKGVAGTVSGNADIILCPDIETATILSQAFIYIGSYPAAGVLLGTFPTVINPRFIPPTYKNVEIALQSLRGGNNQ